MDFEPQKFFIGLVDFFSIFLPGALLAYFGKNWAAAKFLNQNGYPLDGAEHLIVFLFASYLVGHFIFLVGSFLDEWIYDRFRRVTRWGQIERLADGKKLLPRWIRRLGESHYVFGKNADGAVMKVQRLKARTLQPLAAAGAMNSYQWCRALLSKQHPQGLVTVEHFEADSKFFRSFVIALPILAMMYFWNHHWTAGILSLVLVLPAMLRYIDQRFKGTQNAYWLVLTLEALYEPTSETTERRGGPTHAGGVVFRQRGRVEYLLVRSSNKRKWVLPKGRIEPGENMRQAAVRGVLEQTGCWARVKGVVYNSDLRATRDRPKRVYLMECLEEPDTSETQDRQYRWAVLGKAKRVASLKLTKELLEKADRLRIKLEADEL